MIIDSLVFDNENLQNIKSKDNLLINELILECEDIINKYSIKFEKEKNIKLFSNLEDKFNKINEKQKFNNNYNIAIKEKSVYEQSSKNAINTTILIDDIKNF